MVYSHCIWPGMGRMCSNIYDAQMFTLVQDRDRYHDLLFLIMPVPFVGPCSVNMPYFERQFGSGKEWGGEPAQIMARFGKFQNIFF